MTGTAFFSEKVETKDGPKKHLYVIVAEKDMEVLAVPVTSWNNSRYCDNHCELGVGDHKFIKHKSWVDFSKARSYDAVDLYNKIKDGTLGEAERFKKKVVDYIAAKTETSDNLPEKFLSFFDGN